MKIGVIGVGRIGSQIAFLSLMRFRPEKMILIDTKDLTGDILDLQHACKGLWISTKFSTKWERADAYILCAGRARDEKTRHMTVLLKENRKIADSFVPKLRKYAKRTIVVTNPSDEICEYLKSRKVNAITAESILVKMRNGEKSGWKIVKTKKYTNFGPAVSVIKLMESIL